MIFKTSDNVASIRSGNPIPQKIIWAIADGKVTGNKVTVSAKDGKRRRIRTFRFREVFVNGEFFRHEII